MFFLFKVLFFHLKRFQKVYASKKTYNLGKCSVFPFVQRCSKCTKMLQLYHLRMTHSTGVILLKYRTTNKSRPYESLNVD